MASRRAESSMQHRVPPFPNSHNFPYQRTSFQQSHSLGISQHGLVYSDSRLGYSAPSPHHSSPSPPTSIRRPRSYRRLSGIHAVSPKLLLLVILAIIYCHAPFLPRAAAQTCEVLGSNPYGLAELSTKYDYPGNDLEYIDGPIIAEECQRRCLNYDREQCLLAVVDDAGGCALKSAVNRQPARSPGFTAYALPCFSSSCVNTSTSTNGSAALCAPCPTDFSDPNAPRASFRCSDSTSMGFISPANSSWDLTGELVPDDAIIMDIDATECVRRCQTYPGPCVTAQYVPGMQRCVLKKEYGTAVSPSPGYLAFVKKCAVDNGGCGQQLCQQGQPNTCIDPKEYGFRFKDKDLDYTGPEVGGGEGLDSAACVERCQKNDRCVLAQSDPRRLKCWLKGANYSEYGSQQKGRINFDRPVKGVEGRRGAGLVLLLVVAAAVLL